MTGIEKDWRDWAWVAWLALVGTAIPLAYLEVDAGKWAEGSTGYIAINENLKFSVWLWTAVPGIAALGLGLSAGAKCWHLSPGVWKPCLLFVLAALASATYSIDHGRGWLTTLEVFFLPVVVMLAIASRKWEPRSTLQVMACWLPACFLVGLVGMAQFQDHWVSGITEVQNFLNWARNFPRYGQMGSTFYSQNLAAEYLILVIPFFFVLAGVLVIKWKTAGTYLAILVCLAAAICFQFLVISKGRAAWVGLVGGGILGFVLFYMAYRKCQDVPGAKELSKWMLCGLGSLLLAFFLILFLSPQWAKGLGDDPPGPNAPLQDDRFVKEFMSILEKDSNGRFGVWKDTVSLASKETLFLGVGPGHFRIHFPKYIDGSQSMFLNSVTGKVFRQTRRAHNDYLQLWAELGLVGIFAYFWLVGRVGWGVLRSLEFGISGGDKVYTVCILGLASSFAIYSTTMFFDFPSRMPGTLALGWMTMGLLLGMEPREKGSQEIPASWRPFLVVVLAAGCLVCIQTANRVFQGDFFRIQGIHAHNRGETDKAISWTEQALEYLPWDEDSWFLLYHLHRKNMDMEAALKVVQGHLERNPWYYPSMRNEMDCLEQLGKFAEARKSARRILVTFPHHPNAEWFRQYVGE